MRLTERINKLEQRVLPSQTRLVWIDSKDDIPADLTDIKLVYWASVADEVRGAINELNK